MFLSAENGDIEGYIEKDPTSSKSICTLCGKTSNYRKDIRKHLQGVHFKGQFIYECNYCGKNFNGSNSLSSHVSKNHK